MTLTKTPPKPEVRKSLPINVEYQDHAKALLRAMIEQAGTDYEGLAERLGEMGIEITGRGLENKISRGGFSAAFLLQCATALGIKLES